MARAIGAAGKGGKRGGAQVQYDARRPAPAPQPSGRIMIPQEAVEPLEEIQPIRLTREMMVGQRLFDIDIVLALDLARGLELFRHLARLADLDAPVLAPMDQQDGVLLNHQVKYLCGPIHLCTVFNLLAHLLLLVLDNLVLTVG